MSISSIAQAISLISLRQVASYVPSALAALILVVVFPFVSAYEQSLLTKVLIFAVFALSLNLLFGYSGLFSLGHAAYFGVAGYTVGFLTTRLGIDSFWLLALSGIVMATFLAAVFGLMALRVSGVYFLLVTLALGQLLYSIALKWRALTGGSNGLPGIPLYPDLGLPWLNIDAATFYYFVLVIFGVCFVLLYRIANSPFGSALQGIRADEGRMKALGYNTWLFKYIAFVIAGLFAGVAGVLYAYFGGIVAPGHLGITTSASVMLMVIIGSDRVFFGPAIGSAVVLLLEHFASIYTPERWPMVLGVVFVLAVMFLRGGVSIHLIRFWKKAVNGYRSA